jgi:hypothetical protein
LRVFLQQILLLAWQEVLLVEPVYLAAEAVAEQQELPLVEAALQPGALLEQQQQVVLELEPQQV